MLVAEKSGDVVLDELLSDLTSGCEVGDALLRARYALVAAYE